MKKMINYSRKENIEDAEKLVDMLETIDTCPKPVVGRINGHAIGGGCGVVSVCDLAIATSDAKFAFAEVKLGITPATISPYVIRKIGIAATRELFLTGERITAQRAKEIGLVSEVVPAEELEAVVDKKVKLLSSSGPVAMAVVKSMCRSIPNIDPKELKEYTAELIADLRASEEGQEGMGAFLEKRKPNWIK
jgi:methylglutaconyl-CoA hydratase